MTDIVERLRTNHPVGTKPDTLLFEAADEIESLRQQLEHEQHLRVQAENFCTAVQDQREDLRQQLADLEQQYVALNEASIAAIKAAKREAFFEAADYIEKQSLPDLYSERCLDEFARDIRNRAKELE